jgi:hypothetical protein
MVEVRKILLPQGGELEIEIHPGFYEQVRRRFMLLDDQEVTDDHVRMFVWGATRSALDSVEEQKNGNE